MTYQIDSDLQPSLIRNLMTMHGLWSERCGDPPTLPSVILTSPDEACTTLSSCSNSVTPRHETHGRCPRLGQRSRLPDQRGPNTHDPDFVPTVPRLTDSRPPLQQLSWSSTADAEAVAVVVPVATAQIMLTDNLGVCGSILAAPCPSNTSAVEVHWASCSHNICPPPASAPQCNGYPSLESCQLD